ncbi:uncharacterized protein BDZ99DRAFT_576696 [Mytilinidion resinicola]|uniref:Zn(2)-C6 fungal-type domain-containing protein n=1 Tax=Mytilinidion resinicola TaxID=574789 RepID=A0A6A6Y2T6_9PEZI|nr:uncharacterized protein BDZ99DRAFT_576696 [Mytilinidion resinicola]KAF2802843.1 hypothetical protein BDZ99DRAFT_576696 [Mytilinidion resinicola]
MVFRGRPSKACERCRARRLKCDLQTPTCSQCVRASVACSGYRNTQQLRIRDESLAVAKKVYSLKNASPQFLPLSIDLQARDAFFAYYITSKCWNFLRPYSHPTDSPEHLSLAIEAVSLAYLWHQVNSDTALANARERYVAALRMTNKILQIPTEATKEATLLASLLLDLFEKITDIEPRNNKSWTSHVNGALSLVKLRGLEQFQDPSDFDILLRLSSNSLMSCLCSGSPVSDELMAIQAHIAKHLDTKDPKIRLSEVMVDYARFRNDATRGVLSNEQYIRAATELDVRLLALDLELPARWDRTTTFTDCTSERVFGSQYDTYSDPKICLARNLFRVMRILVISSLIEHCLATPEHSPRIAVAQENIEILAREICASVPPYVDCNGAARRRPLASLDIPVHTGHLHTHDHLIDCYMLIFPLYVAGLSNAVPGMRAWVIKQLHHINSHFYIRNAQMVAQILEGEKYVSAWEVYAMLGSYAFVA